MRIASLLAALAAAPQDPPPPVLIAPAGFAVDLVDEAPDLRWPSALHCRADGSLLVAEDPMDMPGPTDQPLDRIWLYRWKADGGFTRTLFAEKLYAAFGLEEIDGAVYVMNMPRLTVLRDRDGDGVAEERTELLTDLGPDAPGWPDGFNDHIVSGLRYGMDGWLYVAVGDKGVPLAHGQDGSTLTLRGGGVIRLRPDGTELQLVASGLRNILDVALDANGELFTFDNTDDGLGWWTRLTHVVPGGFYGYPWDYHGPPERFLAPLAEYGGGSPTGGLVKRAGGWPAPYEGSLFFCEWGDQTLRRFELAPSAGTFQVAAMEEFLQPGKVESFRPTDVCEAPDGRFLYVSDWGYGGWRAKDVTGRLWRVRRADDDGRAPGGAKTVARGPEPARPNTAERIQRLGTGDLGARQRALRDLIASPEGDWSADPTVRAAAWSVAGESAIAKHHWRGLAGSRLAAGELARFFEDGESQALELLDAIGSVALRKAEMRRGALEAEPPRGPFEDLEACGILALARGEKAGANPRVRAKAVLTLGLLARVCEPWDGKWWNIDPARKPRPARTLAWSGTAPALAGLRLAFVDSDPGVRRAAIEAAADLSDRSLLPEVRQRIFDEQDPDLRRLLLETLGRIGSAEDGGLFARMSRKAADLDERMRSLRIGMRLAPAEVVQSAFVLARDESVPAELRSEALDAITGVEEEQLPEREAALELALGACANFSEMVRASGGRLLARLDPERALPILLEQNRDPAVHPFSFHTLAELGDPRAARAIAEGLADPDPEIRSAARRAVQRSKDALRERLEGMVSRQELEGAIVRELRTIYSGYQPILAWDLYGPFALDSAESALDFAQDHGQASLAALRKHAARRAVSQREDGLLDLRELVSAEPDQAAFATAEFLSPGERDVELRAGSDDQLRVWLNGELVHEYDGARGFTAEADRFKARLRAGKNELVLRIGQIGGEWSFAVVVPEVGRGPIFETSLPAQPTAAEYAAFAAENPGDPARGEAVVRDSNRTLCLRCHAIAGSGEHVGPELGGIGARYSRAELVTSILAPSQRIAEGYAAAMVLTQDDQALFGQIQRDDAQGVLLVDSTGTKVEVERADVLEVRPSKQSAMPEGLCGTMSLEEFADLVAWLAAQR